MARLCKGCTPLWTGHCFLCLMLQGRQVNHWNWLGWLPGDLILLSTPPEMTIGLRLFACGSCFPPEITIQPLPARSSNGHRAVYLKWTYFSMKLSVAASLLQSYFYMANFGNFFILFLKSFTVNRTLSFFKKSLQSFWELLFIRKGYYKKRFQICHWWIAMSWPLVCLFALVAPNRQFLLAYIWPWPNTNIASLGCNIVPNTDTSLGSHLDCTNSWPWLIGRLWLASITCDKLDKWVLYAAITLHRAVMNCHLMHHPHQMAVMKTDE